MDKIVLERAQHSDFDEVMKISHGVYNGNDYLPYVYHNWVAQEERGFIPRKNFSRKINLYHANIAVIFYNHP